MNRCCFHFVLGNEPGMINRLGAGKHSSSAAYCVRRKVCVCGGGVSRIPPQLATQKGQTHVSRYQLRHRRPLLHPLCVKMGDSKGRGGGRRFGSNVYKREVNTGSETKGGNLHQYISILILHVSACLPSLFADSSVGLGRKKAYFSLPHAQRLMTGSAAELALHGTR